MRIFVTGATGLLGGHLVRFLVDEGHDVVTLVRDKRGYVPNYDEAAHLLTEVKGDLCDYRTIERALFEYSIDAVFHLGAQTQVRISDGSPYSTLEANIRGTYTILEACRSYGKLKRIVVASSDKAYGGQKPPYKETQSLVGEYPYDVSKSCGDLIAGSYYSTYGLPVVIVRCCNLYGSGDLNWQRIVPATCRFALLDEPLTLRGAGRMKRDYIHVSDAVSAYLAALQAKGIEGQAFNFGSGKPVEIRDIVSRILGILKSHKKPSISKGHPKEIKHQWMNYSKARDRLGWAPTVSLGDGLKEAVTWYRDHLIGKGGGDDI